MQKITLICTLKNEEHHLEEFLTSIISQSHLPDEAIFVDGGSTDGTLKKLSQYSEKFQWFKFFSEPGLNIAQGRNFAIKKSKNQIIISIDAGCILHKHFIKNMIKYFPRYDVVGGKIEPLIRNDFQIYLASIIFNKKSTFSNSPSSRAIAFKKSVWKSVGGYPENLTTAEDTLFNYFWKKRGFSFKYSKEAIVYWEMRDSLPGVAKQYFLYGFGDGISLMPLKAFSPYAPKHAFNSMMMVILGYVFILSAIIGLFYLPLLNTLLLFISILMAYISIKSFKYTRSVKSFIYAPIILTTIRLFYFVGLQYGLLRKIL